MNMIKRIISTVASAIIVLCGTSYISTAYGDELDDPIIYRISCNGVDEGNHCEFIYTLRAYSHGYIRIDVQCKDVVTGGKINAIGDVSYNDSMIAPIGEWGADGCSTFKGLDGQARYLESFAGNNIVYTTIYSDYGIVGKTLMSYNLCVKEPYLTTNQTINLFGTEVEIPFGEPPIDKDAMIEKYKNENAELENRIKEQAEELETVNAKYNEAYATIVNNEIAIAGKDEIINGLMTDNKNLREKISELTENITEFEKVIEDLNAKILMYEDKIAKMSSTAEIVSTMGDDIKRCDINGDSLIDAVDASIILSAYARISTGESIQHISQVVN